MKDGHNSNALSRAAIGLFLVLYPIFEGFSNTYFPLGTTFIGLLVAAIWLFEISRKKTINTPQLLKFLLIFLCWTTLSVFWSFDKDRSIDRVISLTLVLVLYWMIVDTVKSKTDIKFICKMYAWGSILLSLTAVYNIFRGITYNGLTNRYSAIGYDPNNFGVFIMSAVPLFDIAHRDNKNRSSKTTWALFFFMLIVGLSTASRSMLISGIFVFLYMIVSNISLKKTGFGNLYALFSVSLVLVGLIYSISSIIPPESLNRLTDQIYNSANDERSNVWLDAYNIWKDHWFVGIGANATLTSSQENLQAHNTFISAFAELGIVGGAIWVSIWLLNTRTIVILYRREPSLAISLACALICVLIGALTLNWEVRKPLYLVWAIVLAATSISVNTPKRNSVSTIPEERII